MYNYICITSRHKIKIFGSVEPSSVYSVGDDDDATPDGNFSAIARILSKILPINTRTAWN
jgi:hypothetical protein